MQKKGILYTILSAILFGIAPVLTTILYGYGANAFTVVFFRSLFALPILFFLMKRKRVAFSMSLTELKKIAMIAIFGAGLATILLFSSYTYIEIGSATTLHFLYPVCVTILCFFLYKERPHRMTLIALFIAFLGTLCFFDFDKPGNMLGILLAASSALAYAYYMVQLEKWKFTHMYVYKVSFYIAIFIVLEVLLYHLIFPVIHIDLPLYAYGFFILLSILTSLFAISLLQLGITYLGSSTASLFCLFEPITSILCGYFFLQETFTPFKIIGCLLILSALVFMSISQRSFRGLKKRIS